jgi:glyoxylase-like metal-dependent hydrolase (beta-lactamase superfamily II)
MNALDKKYTKLTDNVIVTPVTREKFLDDFRPGHTSMMSCVALPKELVFIDCGMNKKVASEFREDMEEYFQRKAARLILTHIHDDHYLAMEAFKDVEVIAPQIGVEGLRIDLQSPDDEYFNIQRETTELYSDDNEIVDTVRNAKLFIPQVEVEQEHTIGAGEDALIMKVTGGHSRDSSYIYSPKEKVLFAGDNIVSCYAQYVFDHEIIDTYKHWEDLAIDHVVAGHGPPVPKEYITKVREYFEALLTSLKKLKAEDTPVDEVIGHDSLPEYFGTKESFWEEGREEHTGWIDFITKVWYKKL